MTRIRLPYHNAFLEAEIPSRLVRAILTPSCRAGSHDEAAPSLTVQQRRVERALGQPIVLSGSKTSRPAKRRRP